MSDTEKTFDNQIPSSDEKSKISDENSKLGSEQLPHTSGTANATAVQPVDNELKPLEKSESDFLNELDEMEEFPAESFNNNEIDVRNHPWADDWEDDDIEEDFIVQLRRVYARKNARKE